MNTSKPGSATRSATVIERSYRASVEELWALWTTKEGFESWWGPEGFRSEVHTIEARAGGLLRYTMIAVGAEQIAAMKQMGWAPSHEVRSHFGEVKRHQRLTLTNIIDFVPGVEAYESHIQVDFLPAGDSVRMVVTVEPMHDEEMTQRAVMGFNSQLTKLDQRFDMRS